MGRLSEVRLEYRRLWLTAGAILCALLVAMVAASEVAFAAHNARMDVTPTQVEPGGEITVEGLWNFADTPVNLHWGGLDGPIIATLESDGSFGPARVRIPDADPGTYVLVANQEVPEDHVAAKGIPARVEIRVVGPGPGGAVIDHPAMEAAFSVPRLAALQREQTPSSATLVTLAVGTAIATLAIGLLWGRIAQPSIQDR